MSELDLILNRKKGVNEESKGEIQNFVSQQEVSLNNPQQANTPSNNSDNIEDIMRKFLDRDPKIGVWSYPAFLVLQYLYHTIPGFKMSRTAKEALEKGLKEMYPDLYNIAEKIAKENKKI
ncbi:MAG: hypothetical protein L7G92_04760 [Stygiolobus sp.]|jgi:histone H3/H4|nr:hypothetical protein [Stygiolobus sp.]